MTTYGPYSPIKKARDFYFVSGQVGVDPETKLASFDVTEQTHQALKNLDSLLQDNSLKIENVVKTTVFLKNMEDFDTVNEVYMSYFKEPRPARSCVGISELPSVGGKNELLIEIEAIAYKD